MAKTFVFVIPAVLLFMYGACEGLECYHCYSNTNINVKDGNLVPCNEKNLEASNTWTCPHEKARCVYRVLDFESFGKRQVLRTCSNGISDPCDPSTVPAGSKQIKCTHCGTDKCNLNEGEPERPNHTHTLNINANINLYIKDKPV